MSSSNDAPVSPGTQLALSCFEELLDLAVADVASECHRIARLGLDRSVDAEEEELRGWAARVAGDHPGGEDGEAAEPGEEGEQGRARRVRADAPRHCRRCRRLHELRPPRRRRPFRSAPREVHGQGSQSSSKDHKEQYSRTKQKQ